MAQSTFERAMKLAVVTGLKASMGPALFTASRRRPEARTLAMAAMGEMLIDKVPYIVPSRSSWPLLIPRAAAGAWVANEVMKEDDTAQEPYVAAMGAAVAVGVGTFAPLIRGTLNRVLGIPDVVLAVAEDYLALKLGTEAVGMSMEEVGAIARERATELGVPVNQICDEVAERVRPVLQSAEAGSM